MNTGMMIARLKHLKHNVLADGKVDWDETSQLLEVIRPIAKKHQFVFEDYQRLLEKCREDGKISHEESDRLAFQLEFLCGYLTNMRLKFHLALVTLILALGASFVVIKKVLEIIAK